MKKIFACAVLLFALYGVQAQTDHSVGRNISVNQAELRFHTSEVKYYNTDDVESIGIDGSVVTINTNSQQQDVYQGNIERLSFTRHADPMTVIEAKGWQESVYATFSLLDAADDYHVYIRGGNAYADWTQIAPQLVRNYGSYGRADMVGLSAGTYQLQVVPVADGQEYPALAVTTDELEVRAYDRSGFAHLNYQRGIGAYNDDGTLKANARVLYVTSRTAKTVQQNVITNSKGSVTECTGLQAIIDAYQKGYDTTPLAVRFIGLVKTADMDALSSSQIGLQVKGNGSYSEMNITLEGIGDDATLYGFGVLIRNCTGVEVRNLGFIQYPEDAISIDTDNAHLWIHNNDFFYGRKGSGDKDKGDGSIDLKDNSKLVTLSYNHFWDTGKSSMCGMKSESGPNYVSLHHNWFDHSDSRHARVRTMSVHIYNNYFDQVAKYGVGACTGSSVFVENNYFFKTKKPILTSLQGTDGLGSGTFSGEDGGMVKAYGNYFDRTAKNFSYYTQHNPSSMGYDAYETSSRDEQVPATEVARAGGTAYNNFDTDAQVMYSYQVDAAADVPAVVKGYYGAGRLNHGDLQYTFKDNVGNDDADSAIDTTYEALLNDYRTTFVGLFGEEGGEQQGGEDPGDEPQDPQPEGVILASFDGSPSHSMFTMAGDYGDGKITYENTYYKKGVKLNSKGSITFTPSKDYQMTLVMATAKTGRDVKVNGTLTTVTGTENTAGAYYELQPIAISKNKEYVLTKGSAESIIMLIKLVPVE